MKNEYHIGKQIRDIRNKRKMTLLEVATQLGVHYQHIQRIELTGNATIDSLEKIAMVLQHALIIYPKKVYFKYPPKTKPLSSNNI